MDKINQARFRGSMVRLSSEWDHSILSMCKDEKLQ